MSKKIKQYLPILVFVFTVLLGLASIFLSYRVQKLGGGISEIFQAGYPSGTEPPGGPTPTPPSGSGSGPCDEANWWNCYRCQGGCEDGNCGNCNEDCSDQAFDTDSQLLIARQNRTEETESRVLGWEWINGRDVWCCGDEGGNGGSTPPPGATPTPTPTPPPIPSPGTYSCVGLAPQPVNPQPGELLTFECRAQIANVSVDHYNFRVLDNLGSVAAQDTTTTSALQTNFDFTVPATGAPYKAQCQVCISSDDSNCTTWGQQNGTAPVPAPTPTAPPEQPNSVLNPGFESGTTGWGFWADGSVGYQGAVVSGGYQSDHTYRVTTGSDEVHPWGRAACVNQGAPPHPSNSFFEDPVNFAGKTLRFSSYVKTSSAATAARLQLALWTSPNLVDRNPNGGVTSDVYAQTWQYVEKLITIPSNVVRIDLSGCSSGIAGGQAWFDNMSLIILD